MVSECPPPPNVGHTVVSIGMCESIVEKSFGDLDSKGCGRCSPEFSYSTWILKELH